MIEFKNWTIRNKDGILARQYDNRVLMEVAGDAPSGWSWAMLVQKGSSQDVWNLTPTADGLACELTREMLCLSGDYTVQLRGIAKDGTTRHTNRLQIYVPESLSGEGQWPDAPSEFAQIEQRLTILKLAAESAAEQSGQSAAHAESAAQAAASQASAAAESAVASAASAEDASISADRAQTAADRADAALSTVDWAFFAITEEGDLIMERSDAQSGIDFALSDDGILEVNYE